MARRCGVNDLHSECRGDRHRAVLAQLFQYSYAAHERATTVALAMFTNAYALSLTLPCSFASVCMCVRVRVVYVRGCVRRL